ncbi:MAG TPA: hypothetical protein VLV83_25570 [Acidobacteriota bacterium]|nr:hypothetical protein [Acidobacteriota bacterium]
MRKIILICLTLALLPLAASCQDRAAASNGLEEHFDPSYSSRDYWFDGTAELNLYEARLTYYGQPRQAQELVHILVTEDHKPDLLVKADDWRQAGLVKMLKFNLVQRVQTGIYEYRQMMSAFFEQGPQRLAKMTYSSQEWCGHSFKEIVRYDGRESFDFNTYWDGQGNGSFQVDYPQGLILYDTLPVQLRPLKWEVGLTAEFPMLPSQFSSRVQEPRYVSARVTVEKKETVDSPAGTFETLRTIVESGGTEGESQRDILWFEADFPHRMIRWQRANGDTLTLSQSKKLPYWELNQPGDRQHLD